MEALLLSLRLLIVASCLLLSCSTDPLNQKYTDAEGIQPLLSKDIKPPIDESTLGFIIDAKMTNERNGISNEGKTFKELMEQGIQLYSVEISVKLTT